MALNWRWDEKCGEAEFWQDFDGEKREFTLSLYEGNAYMIMIAEFQDENGNDMYNVRSFWLDKQHMKNCLGLDKKGGHTKNIYTGGFDHFTKFRLNKAKSRHWKDIVTALAQAFDNLTIEVYTEEATA